jgi:DNA-binding MarR family transcriptional regulator
MQARVKMSNTAQLLDRQDEPQHAEALDIQPNDVSVAELLAHPRFMEAAQLYVRLNLSARVGEATIAKTFSEPTWHILFCIVAKVSAQNDFALDAPLLTPTYLKSEMAQLGLSSHGKIDSAIKRMIDRGWLEKTSAPDDRRVVVLKPTPALLAVDDDLAAIYARPSALLVDDEWVARIAAGDRAATRGMRAVGKSVVEESFAIIQRNAQMLPIFLPNGGWLVLFALLDAIWRDDVSARRFSAIARRCNVSAPHVKSVLTVGRDHGLMEETAPGLFAPTMLMQQSTLTWIADCFAVSIACCRMAAQSSRTYLESRRAI